jgi:hypothetical protein
VRYGRQRRGERRGSFLRCDDAYATRLADGEVRFDVAEGVGVGEAEGVEFGVVVEMLQVTILRKARREGCAEPPRAGS